MGKVKKEAKDGHGQPLTSSTPSKYIVPGALAPVSNLNRIWAPLLRWVLGSRTTFATFLHSVICNKPSLEEGTATTIWPMPPPYPRRMKEEHGGGALQDDCDRNLEKALNLVVLALSWLHLQHPATAPRSLRLGRGLSRMQWRVVRRFRLFLSTAAEVGDVGPSDMGRTAAKMEGLDGLLADLHGFAEAMGISNTPHGYFSQLGKQRDSEQSLLKPGPALERGEELGFYSGADIMNAKDIEPERLSFPQDRPTFNPAPYLDEEHRQCYEDPASLADNDLLHQLVPPRVQIKANKEQSQSLLRFLDRHHRLSLEREKDIQPKLCCGAFALLKDAKKDRLIVDARPANSIEPTMNKWCKTLGSVSALLQIELAPGKNLYMSGTDLRDYYYCFAVSEKRCRRNTLKMPISQAFAKTLSCYDPELHTSSILYPGLKTLAMGDNNAVELGQMTHVNLGISARAFCAHELLTSHSRGPRGKLAAGIVIDDVLIAEQLPPEEARGCTEGEYRLNLLCELYQKEGLTAHPAKTFRGASEAEVWGIQLDGEKGLCRASLKRLVPLIDITSKTARLGVASVHLLEIIAGAWVAVLQVRRRMLSLLQNIYSVQVGRKRSAIIRLPKMLVAELWMLVILGPLAVADLRAQSMPKVFMTDASSDSIAGVVSDVPLPAARELHRHSLSRGCWGKLLSPWKAFLREHSDLALEEEIPDGVPLVCHPLWVAVAEHLQYHCKFQKKVKRRRHINLLEVDAILKLEAMLSSGGNCLRYLCGSDSQVALASLIKGRSSSYRINNSLRASLGTYLGAGLYGSYGFVPSLSNPADDPTRGRTIREALSPLPDWWSDTMAGDFEKMDAWLARLGYDPITLAGLPFDAAAPRSLDSVKSHIAHLRSVQKPERLAVFDEKLARVSEIDSRDSDCERCQSDVGSPPVCEMEEEVRSRGHKQEPVSQSKIDKRGKRSDLKEPTQAVDSPTRRRVAPPAKTAESTDQDLLPSPPVPLLECSARHGKRWRENSKSPPLSAEAAELLALFPSSQFFGSGGKRCSSGFQPRRRGFLDLYSGAAGVARSISRRYNVWVLSFEYEHSSSEDLLVPATQALLRKMIQLGCFLGAGAAPECGSFSRAVTPAVRSRDEPEGKPDLTASMAEKVRIGNLHAAFTLMVVLECIAASIGYFVENPDGSFLWLQPAWVRSGLALMENAYRFDQCRFGALWRKRTRLATNLAFKGVRQLCLGGHDHIILRGRSSHHMLNWTRVAQVYPRRLCNQIADELCAFANLKAVNSRAGRLDVAGCAKTAHLRVGEAGNPGPRRQRVQHRNADELLGTPLVEQVTVKLQQRVWDSFQVWLGETFSMEAQEQMFRCPSLVVLVLQRYGVELYSSGRAIYEYRHLLVMAQQRMPLLRPAITAAWQLLTKWENLQPLVHRLPLPEILYKAMVSIASMWGWHRWCATLVLVYEGIGRIGEALRACRRDLVLPSDNLDSEHQVAYLKISHPKTRRRGRGKVQHLRIDNFVAVEFLEKHFADIHPACRLFPLSASAFRTRWEKLLDALQVPMGDRPTPASVRGGGAILAYRRGETISNIMWKMRIVHQPTLEAYLQETVADSLLARLPDHCRNRIRTAARFFSYTLQSSCT